MTQKVRSVSQKVCQIFVLKQHTQFRTSVSKLLQFAYSKRFLATQKQEVGVWSIPFWHLTLIESLSALILEVTSHQVNGYPSKGDNWSVIKKMDDARLFVLFNSILVMSGWWTENNETLFAMKPRLRVKRSPPQAGLASGIAWTVDQRQW